jgi:hypothetical protein
MNFSLKLNGILLVLLILGVLEATVTQASAAIHWRLSVKLIIGPGSQLPTHGNPLDPFTAIKLDVALINQGLADANSPYRLDLIEAIGIPDPNGYFLAPVNHETTV